MSVNVRTTGNAPELGSPVMLFKIPAGYDTSADGQRFLALASVEKAEASPMIVVTNWQTPAGPGNEMTRYTGDRFLS